jgi:2-polyprenyl-3-methyl-5-hydroxy-6-metoxy-1,4-benzoquinol methylase
MAVEDTASKLVPELKYWSDVDASPTHRAQLSLIPDGCRVLEVGSAGGHVTKALRGRGCHVTAVERDPGLAKAARGYADAMIEADVETPAFFEAVRDVTFDVILLGDVLEHLVRPADLLRRLKDHLRPSGWIVTSIPNIAHASVRLALLLGEFRYREWGLLDETHVRFFTADSVAELFDTTGYEVRDVVRVRQGFFETEIKIDPAAVPVAVLRQLTRDVDADTYQWVLRAIPRTEAVNNRAALRGQTHASAVRRDVIHAYRRHTWSAIRGGQTEWARAVRLSWRWFILSWRLKPLLYLVFTLVGAAIAGRRR